LAQASLGKPPVHSRRNGRDQTVLLEGQIGYQIVKLENKPNLVPEKMQAAAAGVQFDRIHGN
jgi:hypothetical protein